MFSGIHQRNAKGENDMPRFIIELWMDGYETEKEMEEACEEFIYDQLNFSASSVQIKKIKMSEKPLDKLVVS